MRKVFVLGLGIAVVFALLTGCAEDPNKYNTSGMEKLQNGDFAGAIADFDKVIQLDPQNAMAYINRGNAKIQSGDLEGALADYNKGIEIKPDIVEGYVGRGSIFLTQNNITNAEQDVAKALEIDPNNAAAQTLKSKIEQVKASMAPADTTAAKGETPAKK